MMFKKDFIAVIKNKGKILRERDGIVTLPFGSEYSLLLKNLESRKALVKVSIDGEDALGGQSLIVQPNSRSELRGFLKGKRATNKFKFIQKTKEISDYRGDRIDDGIVRVEFRFEKEVCEPVVTVTPWPMPSRKCPYEKTFGDISCGNVTYTASNCVADNNNFSVNCFHMSSDAVSNKPLDDEGITVKGSKSNQKFEYGSIGWLESKSSVITIRLRGTKKSGGTVRQPLTVKSRLTCSSCGKTSRSTAEFCSRCGTFLE